MTLKTLIALVMCAILIVFLLLQKSNNEIDIKMRYDAAIAKMPIPLLKNLRSLTAAEKKQLFAWFEPQCTIEDGVRKIKTLPTPQVVLWVGDHSGQVSRDGLRWYKAQVFDPLASTGATFWLVDLAAWRFLSLKEEALMRCPEYLSFVDKRNRKDVSEAPSNTLITSTAAVLQDVGNRAPYALLRSKDFFHWLNLLTFKIDSIDQTIADLLVRKDLRQGAARFSLKELGYNPLFLNYVSQTLGKNLLEADHTQVFPLLQYLEGIYYALKIVDQCAMAGAKECTIVFLLPNKEFTYYMVPGEKEPFDTFKRNIHAMLLKQGLRRNMQTVNIYFFPFSYGQDFYDAPFEEKGPLTSTPELLALLSIKNENNTPQ